VRELPDADEFAEAATAVEVGTNMTLGMLMEGAVARRSDGERFSSLAALGEAVDRGDEKARELEVDLMAIREALWKEFTKTGVSVGIEALDEVLLARIQDPDDANPLRSLVEVLWGAAGDAGTLLVFPLHSLGITPLEPLKGPDLLLNGKWELAISSQTNEYGQTAALLEKVCGKLGVVGTFPSDGLRHGWMSRHVEWLTRNPLLLMRIATPIGTQQLDERALLVRLRVTHSWRCSRRFGATTSDTRR
jgi:hypothetical protein